MANFGGAQTKRATEGNEDKAKVLYRELREIMKANSREKLNVVIKEIAGVEPTSWANYISTGKVSEFVVSNLEKFSGLPREIFTCEKEFGPSEKETFRKKICEQFGKGVVNTSIGEEVSVSYNAGVSSIDAMIMQIAEYVSNVNNYTSITELDANIVKLEKLMDLAKSSKTLLEKKLEF